MSYNNRRGGSKFNKGTAAPLMQRRSRFRNNFPQNPVSSVFGNQQNEGFGHFNQQLATRQQQKGIQQKQQQQTAQPKQSQQKQQENLEVKKEKELEEQKQRELEQQKELELQKQKELELQKQKELELQKQKELELQKQRELELQKQKELELQKQKELELQKQKELELQKQKELELQKQKELELQKQKELELQKQQELELQKQKEQEELVKKELEQQKQEEERPENNDVDTMEVEEGACVDGVPQPPISGGDADNKPVRRRFPQRNRKLSKYEIQRRRNLRLSKLLQPKSAMVILNEVGKSVTYNVERSQTRPGPKGYMFKATVVVDDTTHEGYGLSKASAKNEAAEKALKFLVKNKKLIQTTTTEPANPLETEEAMDTTEKVDKPLDIPLAWQQFASFAIYKLLDSWGEDLEVIKEDVKVDKKPAKKLPPNPELINPLMLMNQMLPRVNFLELPKTSNGPFNTFNFQAVVDGETFNGSGVSKKVAKRAVAFAICHEVLGIEYPPEVYTPPAKPEMHTTSSPQPEAITC